MMSLVQYMSTLTCQLCENIFNDPILLSCCGNTICLFHLDEKINCPICKNLIALYKFHRNIPVKQLISVDMHLNEEGKEMKKSILDLDFSDEQKNTLKDLEIFRSVNSVKLAKEKNKIKKKQWDLKKQVDSFANALLNEINNKYDILNQIKNSNTAIENFQKEKQDALKSFLKVNLNLEETKQLNKSLKTKFNQINIELNKLKEMIKISPSCLFQTSSNFKLKPYDFGKLVKSKTLLSSNISNKIDFEQVEKQPNVEIKFEPFSYDSITFLTLDSIYKWDLRTNELVSYPDTFDRDFSYVEILDSNIFIFGYMHKPIRIWNLESKELINSFEDSDEVYCLKALNNNYFASGHKNLIKIWNIQKSVCEKSLEARQGWIQCFEADEFNRLFTGSDDYKIRIWNYSQGNCEKILNNQHEHHNDKIKCLKLISKELLASGGSSDTIICIWDLNSFMCRYKLTGHCGWICDLEFSKINHKLISCSEDKTIKIWDFDEFESNKPCKTLIDNEDSELSHGEIINSIKLNEYDRTLTSCSDDKTIKIWNIDTGKCMRIFRGKEKIINLFRV